MKNVEPNNRLYAEVFSRAGLFSRSSSEVAIREKKIATSKIKILVSSK